MIRIASFASIALLGLAAAAAPARADDVSFGFGFEGGGRHRHRDAWFEVGVDLRGSPRRSPHPLPYPTTPVGFEPRRQYVPPHPETRSETICEPAVYEDRVVPVFRDVTVPVTSEVRVPVYDERPVPIFELRLDRHGHRVRIQVGERIERVPIGERIERVVTGSRVDRIRVGERVERVCVRPERCRVVTREVWVPGRYVTDAPVAFEPRRAHRGGSEAAPDAWGGFERVGTGGDSSEGRAGGRRPHEREGFDADESISEEEFARRTRDVPPRAPRR